MEEVFSLKNKFLWDLWFIKDKGNYHVFYLQSKRTRSPEKRHDNNVSIGHAVSKDLKKWRELPVALKPGKKGDWDDLSLWTGSVIKKGKKYYMFYTGRNRGRGEKFIQKIGLAVSDDLINWKKHERNPILEADKKYYEMNNSKNLLGKISAWRDPFVFKEKGKYYMTISARRKGKKKEYNSCIALAESKDLVNWKVLPPIFSPGKYDEMETSQIVHHKGKYYLFFGVADEKLYEPKWRKKVGKHSGLHCYCSNKLRGRYKPVNKNGVVVEHAEKIFDIRLLHLKGDKYTCIGWLNDDDKGHFIGKMSEAFGLKIEGDEVRL